MKKFFIMFLFIPCTLINATTKITVANIYAYRMNISIPEAHIYNKSVASKEKITFDLAKQEIDSDNRIEKKDDYILLEITGEYFITRKEALRANCNDLKFKDKNDKFSLCSPKNIIGEFFKVYGYSRALMSLYDKNLAEGVHKNNIRAFSHYLKIERWQKSVIIIMWDKQVRVLYDQ